VFWARQRRRGVVGDDLNTTPSCCTQDVFAETFRIRHVEKIETKGAMSTEKTDYPTEGP